MDAPSSLPCHLNALRSFAARASLYPQHHRSQRAEARLALGVAKHVERAIVRIV